MNVLANYNDQRDAFAALLDTNCSKRILLLSGDSGSGKSSLLSACLQQVSEEQVWAVPVDLRGQSAVNVGEVFSRTVEYLSWKRLDRFKRCVEQLSNSYSFNLDMHDINQSGEANQINVALQAPSLSGREDRRQRLTDAWFEDIKDLQRPVLLVFDTYEKANEEVRDWVSGPLLARVAKSALLRVVVAGQKIPIESIDWDRCCVRHSLHGVTEATHWLPVVAEMGYAFLDEILDPLSYLAGICKVTKGKPADICKITQSFPRLQ